MNLRDEIVTELRGKGLISDPPNAMDQALIEINVHIVEKIEHERRQILDRIQRESERYNPAATVPSPGEALRRLRVRLMQEWGMS